MIVLVYILLQLDRVVISLEVTLRSSAPHAPQTKYMRIYGTTCLRVKKMNRSKHPRAADYRQSVLRRTRDTQQMNSFSMSIRVLGQAETKRDDSARKWWHQDIAHFPVVVVSVCCPLRCSFHGSHHRIFAP